MTSETTTPALLKDILGSQALETIAGAGARASSRFDRDTFLSAASNGLDALSIMERVRHIADALKLALPSDYADALAILRAMAPDLAILVADEPTGNLDETTGKQIVDLLFAKHLERGMTLVLVTHDTALAQRCDRVVRLRSGRIDGPATDRHWIETASQ